jgi:hypothetical protein
MLILLYFSADSIPFCLESEVTCRREIYLGEKQGMKHFSGQEWVDFVRDTLRQDRKAEMQTHLDQGCRRCQREVNVWLRVYETASRQRADEPADSAVRFVKGSFAITGRSSTQLSRGFLAEVLFDSYHGPLPAGVRSAASSSRQLLYGAGDIRIDLRLEPQVDSESVSLIGQILDSSKPETGPAETTVALLKGGKVVSEASTNRFGEFRLECDLGSRLELRVTLPTRKQISISLIDPIPTGGRVSPDVNDSTAVKFESSAQKGTRKQV